MTIFINPGSGPVADATEQNAADNIKAFDRDLDRGHDLTVTWIQRQPDKDYGDGRYAFDLTFSDGRTVEVQMPGLPLKQVRFTGADDQNIWDFPRLYVDGSSWVWEFAADVCGPNEGDEL